MFDSRDEANEALPLLAVARNHRVYTEVAGPDGKRTYGIYRNITDRKRALVKGGFVSEDDAMRHMAKNPVDIIEHKFPDWEDYSYLDSVNRDGPKNHEGDVTGHEFQKAFGFHGGQFGNWQTNRDGQTSLNHAYDALHDLADATGLPSKAMSLNGELGIGFGARGTGGKHAAKAHYEPGDNPVINLTKMKGAGSLAHEWFHALDNYMGKQAHGNPASSHLLTNGVPYNSKASPEVADAWKNLVNTMHYKSVTKGIDPMRADKLIKLHEDGVRKHLEELDRSLEQDPKYNKRHKPFTPEQRKQWNELKAKVATDDVGKEITIAPNADKSVREGGMRGVRFTHENVESMNKLFKASTGRMFHTAAEGNRGGQLLGAIRGLNHAKANLESANAGGTETSKLHTDFLRNAKVLDNTRRDDYYTLPHEMAARAFAAYIQDKIEAKGNKSEYLTAKTHNKHYAPHGLLPFPHADERTAINAAFDKLFSAIKHEQRTDDKGEHVRLYEKPRGENPA